MLQHLAFPMASEAKLAQKHQAGFNMLALISLFCIASEKGIAFTNIQHHIIYQFFHLTVKY